MNYINLNIFRVILWGEKSPVIMITIMIITLIDYGSWSIFSNWLSGFRTTKL